MSGNDVLIGLRASIGAGAWVAPGLAGRLFGLDAIANPQLPYVGRLFGVRDVALAAGLQLSSGHSRRLWLELGILCDAADTVAGFLGGRNGQISKLSTVLVTAPALLGIGLGIAGLQAAEETPAAAA
ncbi:MAG: hypothetical protein ACLP0J_18145 [Solirubrobacteraceae bacterium]|jgi:hypothetical protein